MWMQKQSKYENTAYVALWGLLFAAPLLSLYVRTASDSELSFNWQEVFIVWRHIVVYLLVFLVHNFILAPLLIHRHKRWLYGLLTLCLIGLFSFYQCQQRPDEFRRARRIHRMEMRKQCMMLDSWRITRQVPWTMASTTSPHLLIKSPSSVLIAPTVLPSSWANTTSFPSSSPSSCVA